MHDSNDRDRILDASDIADVVGEHCALKPKGREYVCLCPFHDDRNPSMYVVPHKQIFHCFVCGAGGNAIDFVMRYHGMGFREALELLANKAGVELTKRQPTRRGVTGETSGGGGGGGDEASRDDIARANAFALEFYRSVLQHKAHGEAARAVIAKRGIAEEMVEAFAIGAAPERFDGLVRTIEARKLDPRPFVAAGLLKPRERAGGHYDALRNRLIFPILDQAGRPIAFGGRIINPEDNPKYLNSPETKLFQKGSTLYGLKQAWPAIRREKAVVVTEGYTDVIACHQAGFEHVVATLGTALTERHANLLKRVVDRVILLFDGDEAGQRAADRALEVFFREPVDVQIAVLPGGGDPDDVLKQPGGEESFQAALDDAVDALDYRFGRFAQRLDKSGLGVGSHARAALIEQDLRRLVELGLPELSPIVQGAIAKRYAKVAGVDEAAVRETLTEARRTARRRPRNRPGSVVESTASAASAEGPDGVGSRSELSAPRSPKTAADHALACVLAQASLAKELAEWTAAQVALRDDVPFGEPSDFVHDLRALTQNGAYSSAPARRIAQRIDAWAQAEGAHLGLRPDQAALARVLSESGDEDELGVARSFAMAAERLSEGDSKRIAEHWFDCLREVKRAAGVVDARDISTPAGAAHGSGLDDAASPELAALLEARRKAHDAFGGNPRAMPRPRV